MDPEIYPDPHKYQPLREINKISSVVTPNKNKLAFGWGTQACPGRFFAAKEIKMFVARLVSEFDFKIIPGTETQRRSFDLEDYRVLNPKMKLLMRRIDGHRGLDNEK
jgi:cytochrome P450